MPTTSQSPGWVSYIPLIAATLTSLVSLIISIYAASRERRNRIEQEDRVIKQQVYLELVNALGDMGNIAKGGNNTVNTNKLIDAHNRMLLVASPKSLKALYRFEECITPNADVSVKLQYDERMDNLLKEMRKDLSSSKKVNKDLPSIRFLSGVLPSQLDEIILRRMISK
ncbi:MAG: hypothetical protein ACOX7B_05540 [Christensenellales bacterium]|jgi:hypothetical protein